MEMLYMSYKKCAYLAIIGSLIFLILWLTQPIPTKHSPLLHTIDLETDHYQSFPKMDKPNSNENINTHITEIPHYDVYPELLPTVQKCLRSNPPMLEEEFLPSFKGSEGGFVCSLDYKRRLMWDVNFNIERNFTFCDNRKDCKPENTTGIPKMFHFIWTTEVIPKLFVKNLRDFRKHHPNWTIHFWSLKTGRKFIEKHEPFLLKLYDKYKRDVDRADVLRYVILFYYGGAYFDIDSSPIKPLDRLANEYNCIVGPEPIENAVVLLKTRSILANSAIMCVGHHAFIRKLIDSIPVLGKRLAGPLFFSNVFNVYLQDKIFPPKKKRLRSDFKLKEINTDLVDQISVIRHEYFEFHLNKVVNISKILSDECKKYESDAKQFLKSCRNKESRSPNLECHIPPNKEGWSTKLFQACIEWINHGGIKRTGRLSQIYVYHDHYGTYTKTNFILHNPGPNISAILPKAILHIT